MCVHFKDRPLSPTHILSSLPPPSSPPFSLITWPSKKFQQHHHSHSSSLCFHPSIPLLLSYLYFDPLLLILLYRGPCDSISLNSIFSRGELWRVKGGGFQLIGREVSAGFGGFVGVCWGFSGLGIYRKSRMREGEGEGGKLGTDMQTLQVRK